MKKLTQILLATAIGLSSCKKLNLPEVNLAHYDPDTSEIIIIPDTTFVNDTIILDSLIVDNDTIVIDSVVEDTIIYTPYFYDENVFLYFSDKNYSNGELFDYEMELSNLSTSDLNFNNSNKCLVYTLLKEQDTIFRESISEDFDFKMKEQGYMGIEKRVNETDLIISGINGKFDGRNYFVPYPLEIVLTRTTNNFKFSESGTYNMEVDVRYKKGNSNYSRHFYLNKFEVGEWFSKGNIAFIDDKVTPLFPIESSLNLILCGFAQISFFTPMEV